MYRPPGNNEKLAVERYDNLISKCLEACKKVIIGTDHNMNLLKIENMKKI